MVLTWSEKMATGNRQIDLQHQELIEILHRLHDADASGRQSEAMSEVLPKLASYSLFHFATEEALMAESGLASDHFAKHKKQHQSFIERIETERRCGDGTTLPGLVEYLNAWLVGHIMDTDRQLVKLIG